MAILALGLARSYLLREREASAQHQTFANALLVRSELRSSNVDITSFLATLPIGRRVGFAPLPPRQLVRDFSRTRPNPAPRRPDRQGASQAPPQANDFVTAERQPSRSPSPSAPPTPSTCKSSR